MICKKCKSQVIILVANGTVVCRCGVRKLTKAELEYLQEVTGP